MRSGYTREAILESDLAYFKYSVYFFYSRCKINKLKPAHTGNNLTVLLIAESFTCVFLRHVGADTGFFPEGVKTFFFQGGI